MTPPDLPAAEAAARPAADATAETAAGTGAAGPGGDRDVASGFATRAIHAGWHPCGGQGLVPPLELSNAFAFDSADHAAAVMSGAAAGHAYTRFTNPTIDLLERRIASLEGAEAAVATGSGVGAIAAVMWALLEPGDEVICHETLYSDTTAFLQTGPARLGVRVTPVDLTDPAALKAALGPSTRLVHYETPTNPTQRLVDIAAVSALAREAGSLTVVDSTYATPWITRPIDLGADLVVHSLTKYLGGHGDLIGGMVAGPAELMRPIRRRGMKTLCGAPLAPFNAMLALRGLKTLALRMERHCANALAVARALAHHPAVAEVHYVGLEDHPQHMLARRQMRAFGGTVAFELAGGTAAGRALMDRLSLIARAVSLGEPETMIQHPASMSHAGLTPDQRRAQGISDGLIRISVGLEEVEDILADLIPALDAL